MKMLHKETESKCVKIVSIGLFELDLTLSLSEKQAETFKINNSLHGIDKLSDCKSFLAVSTPTELKDEDNILNHIRLTSSNELLNSLLFINRACKQKSFIEYIILNEPLYSEEEEFMKEVVRYVTEHNLVFIAERNIYNIPSKVTFAIKILGEGDEVKAMKKFELCKENKQGNCEQGDIERDLFQAISFDFDVCNYFYINVNDIMNNSQIPPIEFLELVNTVLLANPNILLVTNFPDLVDNITNININILTLINELLSIADIFLFEKTEALAMFNLLRQVSPDYTLVEGEKSSLCIEHIFIKKIKKRRMNVQKIAIIMDEMDKVTIIHQQANTGLMLFHSDFEFEIIPPNVSKNTKEEYTKLIAVHHHILKSVFIGGLLSRLLCGKSYNTCFTAGNESVKRIIEILRFKLDYPKDPSYYEIGIKKSQKKLSKEDIAKRKKEQHFVLDCTNLINSKMKSYNPLFDRTLQSYFSSNHIWNHLKKVGFINKTGIILQDPDINNYQTVSNKSLIHKFEEDQKYFLKLRESNQKMKLQIANPFHCSTDLLKTATQTELDQFSKVYNFHPIASRRLQRIDSDSQRGKVKSQGKCIRKGEIYLKAVEKSKRKHKDHSIEHLDKAKFLKFLESYEKKVLTEEEKTANEGRCENKLEEKEEASPHGII